jgi:hypothetical protein
MKSLLVSRTASSISPRKVEMTTLNSLLETRPDTRNETNLFQYPVNMHFSVGRYIAFTSQVINPENATGKGM